MKHIYIVQSYYCGWNDHSYHSTKKRSIERAAKLSEELGIGRPQSVRAIKVQLDTPEKTLFLVWGSNG